MAIKSLQTILSHKKPGFACYACGDKSKAEKFIAPVTHEVALPASKKSLAQIPSIGGSKDAVNFYAEHDGAQLYSGEIEIFSIDEWSGRTEQSIENWEEAGYEDDEMPYGRNDFLAIAYPQGASTYVHWVTRGPAAGQVWWWASTMPPARDASPAATTFRGFIDMVCNEPVRFLNEVSLCYTRFSDGRTVKQWIPIRYIPDLTVEV